MKYKLLIAILIFSLTSYSQGIIVEKIKLTETVDNRYVSEIPKVNDLTNDKNLIVEKINSQILDRFMISSFKQIELEEFRWYDVGCSSEIKENVLYISFAGEYYGAYPNYVEDEFYFDLKTGEPLKLSIIPFQALFTLSGYLDFLNKYWLEGVKKEFITAIECAEFEPYCSYYDIYSYSVNDNKLSISLANDCYPRVAQSCSPGYGISVEIDTLKQYLNEVGKYILLESNYLSKTPIEKFFENEKNKERIQNNIFIFGKINDKYPISMAINIDSQGVISGYYYYDSKLQKLTLKGEKKGNTISLIETFENKQTGFFEIKFSNEYDSKGYYFSEPNGTDKYVIGKWMNPEKTKIFDININEIKTCNKN
jgi:hypothetical protein